MVNFNEVLNNLIFYIWNFTLDNHFFYLVTLRESPRDTFINVATSFILFVLVSIEDHVGYLDFFVYILPVISESRSRRRPTHTLQYLIDSM